MPSIVDPSFLLHMVKSQPIPHQEPAISQGPAISLKKENVKNVNNAQIGKEFFLSFPPQQPSHFI